MPEWLGVALAPGWVALRRNWKAFLAIQVCALALLVCYFTVPAVTRVCGQLMMVRQEGGILVAAVVAAIAGGVVPELFKALMGAKIRWTGVYAGYVAYNTLFFFYNGFLVDGAYSLQAWFWGGSGEFGTAVKKMAVDQFVLTPLLFLPSGALLLTWRDFGFSFARLGADLRNGWYLRRVVPTLLPCWCFWIPMTLMIFSLPRDLQLCLFALALAAWNLVAVYILSTEEGRTRGHA